MAAPETTAELKSISEVDLDISYSRRISQDTVTALTQTASNAGQPDVGAWIASLAGPAIEQALAAQGVTLS